MKFLKLIKRTSLIVFAYFLSVNSFVFAQIENPIQSQDFATFTQNLLSVVKDVGGVVVTLGIIYTGFLFVMAQGKPAELQKAKTALMWTLVGSFILLGAWVIASAIVGTVQQL
ncbi:MAG: TrbC/VirB2 family protein [Candidatus Paceibacterota bacterium]